MVTIADIGQIKWLFLALAFSAGISPFILLEHFRKKDLKNLLSSGSTANARILGYEWRGEGRGRHFVVVYQFQPLDAPDLLTYSKTISGKIRPAPGSVVPIHYNAKFPMISAIDAFGLNQEVESFPDKLSSRKEYDPSAFPFMFVFLMIGFIFWMSGPVNRDDLIQVNGKVVAVEKRHNRYDYLLITVHEQSGSVKSIEMHKWGKDFGLYEALRAGDDVRILANRDAGRLDVFGLTANDVKVRSADDFLLLKKHDYFNAVKMSFVIAFVAFIFGLYGLFKKRKGSTLLHS